MTRIVFLKLFTVIVLLVLFRIESVHSVSLIKSDTVRCVSCMSKLYEAVWPSLSHIYKRPQNFTDECNDEQISNGRVAVVNCPTICVSLSEEPNIAGINQAQVETQLTIAGVRIKGHIRGCMSDVLINGFNQTIVSWYRWMHRDSCRPYRKKDLFKLNQANSVDDSTINVCTCYADNCNSASKHSSSSKMLTALVVIIIFIRFL